MSDHPIPFSEHIYHHQVTNGARVNITLAKNTKGFNYEVSVQSAGSQEEALELITATEKSLASQYGAEEMKAQLDAQKAEQAKLEEQYQAEYRELDAMFSNYEVAIQKAREILGRSRTSGSILTPAEAALEAENILIAATETE